MQVKAAVTEKELGELGIFRIPIPVPFRQAGGPANAYVIEEEHGLLLFDTGLGTALAQVALGQGLARTGHRFEEVDRIILSHGHIDHFGAAAWVLEQIGHAVPVLIHRADADKVLESGDDWPALLTRSRGYFSRLGVPPAELDETIATLRGSAALGRRLASVAPLVPGESFRCRHVSVEVLHMPGHTPGLCCLYDRDHRLLLSADHLLEQVSPNPLMELSEPVSSRPLITYFQSIDRLRSFAIDLVFTGHANPFGSPVEVMDSLSAFYERRQSKILEALQDGPLTVYQVMKELFCFSGGFELVLMVSEALGNLEALEDRGRIERITDGDIIRFRRPV